MQMQKIESFKVIGIAIRTTNQNGQAAQDIPKLWSQFMSNHVLEQIPNKISNDIYCLYTKYESDFMAPYTTVLGCKVSSLETVPDHMEGIEINGGNYAKFEAQGDLNQGIVINKWKEIWATELDRVYTTDFEIYGERAKNPNDAHVDIYIAIK